MERHYIWTLNSHELFGPFTSTEAAEQYAISVPHPAFCVVKEEDVSPFMFESLRAIN